MKRGIPFAIRGRVWSELLDTSVRKRKDYYHVGGRRMHGDDAGGRKFSATSCARTATSAATSLC